MVGEVNGFVDRLYDEAIARRDAEIERLTRERDDYCRQLTQGIRAMRDVCTERDRLAEHAHNLDLLALDNQRTINGLRAALERIAYADSESFLGVHFSRWLELRDIAREALAGGRDE